MTEPAPILTVGDLKSELSRWSRNAGDFSFASEGAGVQVLSLSAR
jgi:hypothetical protein